MQVTNENYNPSSNSHLLLAYIADLELEVDRLRKQAQLVQNEARDTVMSIQRCCQGASQSENATQAVAGITAAIQEFAAVLHDLHEPPGYHPAHDQVIAIAVRPLAEQVFRWQQRLLDAPRAELRMELSVEYVEWFPARLRHILDNLISNALRYRDPTKGEARVFLGLSGLAEGYELRVSDNGLGMPWNKRAEAFELFYRAAPARAAGLGVGLAVVKLLVEQSGGTLTVESSEGQGTSVVVVLPRYNADDYLNSALSAPV
jgi:signal transduction histidine kinase